MLIEIQSQRWGIKARPVSKVWSEKFGKHMLEMTGHYDSSCFWQEEYHLPEEITMHPQYRHLKRGWPIQIQIDPWLYGMWLGYDACNVE